MTSDAFQSLYYTDCRPGQGLRGGAGFQFQSVSAGVGHDVMTLVQRSALYEAPTSWMREHRPPAAYPPSLAHVYDGVYVTARGIYLGAEANGVREGNQFTHAVATADPEHYGLVRPAQLWGAPWWSEAPADSTECDPVSAQPERGPLGIDATREWVLGRPDAEEWLTAVYSAFDRIREPRRRRVVFVAADPAAILGWIAAGTLLLPQAHALRLGFRVFTNNPQYSQHDVLGVHPDWAGSLANPGRDGEFVVFNLEAGRHSPVEPTESASFWVPKFLRADPFDAVDAIELAHSFASKRTSQAEKSAAARESAQDRLASAVVMLDEPCPDGKTATELAGWLAGQGELSGEDIVVPIAEAVLAARPDLATLREFDGTIRRHGVRGELASRIRLAVLAAELDNLLSGNVNPSPEPLARHSWTAAGGQAALDRVERVAATLAPEQLDQLFRICTRFGVQPRMANIRDALYRFASWWADHPAAQLDPSAWPGSQLVVDQLRDELSRRPDDKRIRAAIRDHWWPFLLPIGALDTALDVSVAAAAVERGTWEVRRQVTATVLDVAAARAQPDAGDIAWDALFRYVEPKSEQVLQLLLRLRPGTTSAAFGNMVSTMLGRRCAQVVTNIELDAIDALDGLGWRVTSAGLESLFNQNRALRSWLDATAGGSAQMMDAASHLAKVTTPVLRARGNEVLHAMLELLPVAKAYEVAVRARAGLATFLLAELARLWSTSDTRVASRAVALSCLLIGLESTPDSVAVEFEERLKKWIRSVPIDQSTEPERWLRTVGPDFVQDWRAFVDSAATRRRAERRPRQEVGEVRIPHVQPVETGTDDSDPGKLAKIKQAGGRLLRRRGD